MSYMRGNAKSRQSGLQAARELEQQGLQAVRRSEQSSLQAASALEAYCNRNLSRQLSLTRQWDQSLRQELKSLLRDALQLVSKWLSQTGNLQEPRCLERTDMDSSEFQKITPIPKEKDRPVGGGGAGEAFRPDYEYPNGGNWLSGSAEQASDSMEHQAADNMEHAERYPRESSDGGREGADQDRGKSSDGGREGADQDRGKNSDEVGKESK